VLILIDPHSGVPVYRQMIDQIRFQIASGLLEPGAELPSTRALSQQLGVNPMTVSKAYSLLEKEGIVERRPGLPLVVGRLPVEDIERERIDQLQTLLEPAVTAARQLGIRPAQALTLFRRLLGATSREPSNR
jgi:GntR family transcriptional regulator